MNFDSLNFEWDNTIKISNRLYPTKISTYTEMNTFETIEYTAKEFIEKEIYKAKKEIEICNSERKSLNKLESKYRNIKKLNKIYKEDIESIDFLGIFDSEELESRYEELKEKFIQKEKELKDEIEYLKEDIRTKQFIIKRICLENVSLILKTDGVSNFKNCAMHLLSMNDIEITDKKKHKILKINNYKQMLQFP